MQKKQGLILLVVLLVVAGAVAASQADGRRPEERTMPNYQQPTGSSSPESESVAPDSGDDDDVPKPQAPTTFGGWSGGMPMGDSPNYVPSYDPMKSTGGTEEFGQTIRDQSSIQENPAGEISHNVDNSVANPIVESGEATVVSPSATNGSAPSGE